MFASPLSRRDLLTTTSCGFGMLAFAGLFSKVSRGAAAESDSPLALKQPHFTPKAKRVIFMFMQGGPSHVDMFDYKPRLEKEAQLEKEPQLDLFAPRASASSPSRSASSSA